MRAHHVTSQLDVYIFAAGAAFLPLIQLNVAHVGHEVHFELTPPEFSFASKILILFRGETIGEGKLVAKDEVEAVKQIHHERCVGHGKISGRRVTLSVEMLVMGVKRNREKTSRVPFE